MSRRSRRSVELPLLKPFISASVVDPSALSPVSFSGMDMEKETILVTIHGEDDVSLRGYRICDFDQHHWFEFPSTFVLPAGSTVTIFCCPGLYLEKQPGQLFLLWLNKDGSVRSKNVLNDGEDIISCVFYIAMHAHLDILCLASFAQKKKQCIFTIALGSVYLLAVERTAKMLLSSDTLICPTRVGISCPNANSLCATSESCRCSTPRGARPLIPNLSFYGIFSLIFSICLQGKKSKLFLVDLEQL